MPSTSLIRDSAVEAATELFARQGFEATSLQAIADEVGVKKPSLLYHFSSKDALRQAVIDRMLAHWSQVLPRILLGAARADRFEMTIEALVDFFMEDTNRARILLREALDRPAEMRSRLSDAVRPWIALVGQQLEEARVRGFVHADADPMVYTVQIMHLVISTIAVVEPLWALLPSDGGGSTAVDTDRWRGEIIRIARAALFTQSAIESMARPSSEANQSTKS